MQQRIEQIILKKGTRVKITQSLGGDFTLYVNGNLIKISGNDADAIGETVNKDEAKTYHPFNENLIWDQLKTCFDPEIPVNIVDLGLIYDLSKKGNIKDGFNINIKMTLTAPGCGMGPSIAQDVDNKVSVLPGVNDVLVEIVWEPMWDRDMMSDEAKLQLGMM